MKKILFVIAIFGFFVSANAKNDVTNLSIQAALNSDLARQKLDPSIKFVFGSSAGKTITRGLTANKKTNAFGKDKEVACQRAFISALITFQQRAKKEGGNKVVNITSYYYKNHFSSKSEFQCGIGNVMVGVTLKGDIAK